MMEKKKLTDKQDILFLGSLFPKGHEEEILQNSITGIQNASNVLQQGIVAGLDEIFPGQIRILNSLHIGSFPKHYKKPLIQTYNFSQTKSGKDLNAGFINIKGIKHSSRLSALKPHVKKWAMEKNEGKKVIIGYAASATCSRLLLYAKRWNSDVKTCMVVADLPEHMSVATGRSLAFKLFVQSENQKVWQDIKHIDSFVLLTELMAEAMQLKVPYTVVEGIASDVFGEAKEPEGAQEGKGIKTILYTGSLTEKYGIMDLVNAFELISDESCRLIICGEGETDSRIKRACERDCRIEFRGLIKRDEALRLQREATLLVNPRPNNEEFTKYSFPSKIMEYMSSGTPVAAYLLDGMPKEYSEFMFTIEGREGVKAVQNTLSYALSQSDKQLHEMGKKARSFVLSEKNKVKQAEKIADLIGSSL